MFKVETDQRNKYVDQGLTVERCYELADGWTDLLPPPEMKSMHDCWIIDDAVLGLGTKARWADLLMSRIETDEIVYVQPRCGWAGISLAYLADKYCKKLTLFMPAAAQPSDHQLVAIERGASPIFRRIAAMPVLNAYALAYAKEKQATFVPFGLDHELVVAGGVVSTLQWSGDWQPDALWTVISTGVLTRTLQICWPRTEVHGVAVARNLHDGEVGRAEALSYDRVFTQPARIAKKVDGRYQSPDGIDSAVNYDLKGIEMMAAHAAPGSVFWNVAGNVYPEWLKPSDVDSQREWGETR